MAVAIGTHHVRKFGWRQHHTTTLKGQSLQVRAYAAAGPPLNWCTQYGLKTNRSYAFEKYGDMMAHNLAMHWCSVMAHFYNVFVESGNDQYVYTKEEIDMRPEAVTVMRDLRKLPKSHGAHAALAEIDAITPRKTKP